MQLFKIFILNKIKKIIKKSIKIVACNIPIWDIVNIKLHFIVDFWL